MFHKHFKYNDIALLLSDVGIVILTKTFVLYMLTFDWFLIQDNLLQFVLNYIMYFSMKLINWAGIIKHIRALISLVQ